MVENRFTGLKLVALKAWLLTLGLGAGAVSGASAAEWQSHTLNAYTSDSIAQLFWLPSDPTNPTQDGYSCKIEYRRPSLEENAIEGEGGIRCTNDSSEPFVLPFDKDEISAFGTHFDHIQIEFSGALQRFMSEQLMKTARAAVNEQGDSTDPRVSSGMICDPNLTMCLENFYLNDSAKRDSGASLICARVTDRVSPSSPENTKKKATGEWIDEEIARGTFKVSKSTCVFTGP